MYRFLEKICCRRKKVKGVYTLKLKDNKYYIGKSNDIDRRIWVHTHGCGSAWTKKHSVIQKIPTVANDEGKLGELIETLECMKLYGINNVRGSMFTQTHLSKSDKIKAAELYCEMYDLCRKCGSNNHFIRYCKNDKMVSWVENFGGKLIDDNKICKKCFKDINSLPSYYRYCNECYT
jgi:hypothetical protein